MGGCLRTRSFLFAHPVVRQQATTWVGEEETKVSGHGMGNARLRNALYWPAIVAMRHNPLLKAFSDRLLGRGKVKMQAISAVMRKLLHMAFGILKSQKPFDPYPSRERQPYPSRERQPYFLSATP